jgi:hypothetical protein
VNFVTDAIKEFLDAMTPVYEELLWRRYVKFVQQHVNFQRIANEEGYYERAHATTFASFSACKRQVAFEAYGYSQDNPIDWRGKNTFATGHMIEAWIKALQLMIGQSLETRTSFPVPGWVTPEGYQIFAGPDAIIELTPEQHDYFYDKHALHIYKICEEIKSISHKGFEQWVATGVQSSKPGYYDQAQIYMAATGLEACLFVVENKNTGDLHEELVLSNTRRFDELTDLFNDVYELGDPFAFDRPAHLELEPITTYHRGKNAPDTTNELIPNDNKNGTRIGWYEVVGHKLTWQCGYCDYRDSCWSPEYDINFELDGDRPVWRLTPKVGNDG